MSAVGSHTTAHHVKKLPDNQKETVAKINPLYIMHKERVEQLANTLSTLNGFNSAYYTKGLKIFKDFKKINKNSKFTTKRLTP
jgi:hypothetical protein